MQAANGRLTLIEDRFSNLDSVAREAGFAAVDGVVLDLGVSSMQLDRAERGFSFRLDGPLDMRMSGEGPSAADVVAAAPERDLANIIFILGEERHSRVGRARHRQGARARRRSAPPPRSPTSSPRWCARARAISTRPRARSRRLRIFVNDELGELVGALTAAERILKPHGRLVAVSFHSLEDRIVKSFLAGRSETRAGSRHAPELKRPAPTFSVLTKRPVVADADEVAHNPRARSAKLRAAERSEAPARTDEPSDLLPRLPALADVVKGH